MHLKFKTLATSLQENLATGPQENLATDPQEKKKIGTFKDKEYN
jgi:hypothetical protein